MTELNELNELDYSKTPWEMSNYAHEYYVESEYVAFILPPWSIAHFIDLRELILKFKSHCSENPKPLGAEHAKNEWNHFLPFSKFYFSNNILCHSA